MKPYLTPAENVLNELRTSADGLSAKEAQQRLTDHGPNRLAEGRKVSLLSRFLKQLSDPMIIVLLVAAVLSGITSAYAGESMADVFIILFVVLLNSVLGVVQESKAEQAIDALKTMTAATSKVLRGGRLTVVKSEELVPRDEGRRRAVRERGAPGRPEEHAVHGFHHGLWPGHGGGLRHGYGHGNG